MKVRSASTRHAAPALLASLFALAACGEKATRSEIGEDLEQPGDGDSGSDDERLDGGEVDDARIGDVDAGDAVDASQADAAVCGVGYQDLGAQGCAPLLLGLTSSAGSLAPALASHHYAYALSVMTSSIALSASVPTGASVSIAGQTMPVGASWTSPLLFFGDNAVELVVSQQGHPSSKYELVIKRSATASYIKASNTDDEDRFGEKLSLSADGQTLVVGAYYESSAATGVNGEQDNEDATNAGAVYVFSLNAGVWQQTAYLKGTGSATASDFFGSSVSLSADGNTLAVGAFGEGSVAGSSGAVYVFTRSGSSWHEPTKLKASNAGAGDWFGFAVALSADGTKLVVGAPNESSSATEVGGDKTNDLLTHAGAAYFFELSDDVWTEQAYIKASNTSAVDYFGRAVALSDDGSVVAVGAPFEDGSAGGVGAASNDDRTHAGAVYVYTRSNGTWSNATYIKAAEPKALDYFGGALALAAHGSVLAVGADSADSSAGTLNDTGAVFVYRREANTWSSNIERIEALQAAAGEQLGYSLALTPDGSTLLAGAPGNSSAAKGVNPGPSQLKANGSGAAFVFEHRGAQWTQRTFLKATNTGVEDTFGQAVAISSDGSVLAVGAQLERGGAKGIDGEDNDDQPYSGAAYVYR